MQLQQIVHSMVKKSWTNCQPSVHPLSGASHDLTATTATGIVYCEWKDRHSESDQEAQQVYQGCNVDVQNDSHMPTNKAEGRRTWG